MKLEVGDKVIVLYSTYLHPNHQQGKVLMVKHIYDIGADLCTTSGRVLYHCKENFCPYSETLEILFN